MKNRLLFYCFFIVFLLFLFIFKPWFEQKYLVSGNDIIHNIVGRIPLVSQIDYVTYWTCPNENFGAIILNCYSFSDYKANNKKLPWNKLIFFIDPFNKNSFNNNQTNLLNKVRAKDLGVELFNLKNGYYFNLNKNNQDDSTYLAFVWDTNFADRWYDYYLKKGKKDLSFYKDFFYSLKFNPFKNNSFLHSFDWVIANLETTIYPPWTACNSWWKSIVLRTKEKYLDFFKEIWITHFNISNNHSYDCWKNWFNLTKSLLNKHKYPFFWEWRGNESNILEANIDGKKFVFIWMNDTTFHSPFDKIIKKFNSFDWFKIANFHWWKEYATTWSNRQKELANKFKKANLIIGHHPHVVQNYEKNNTVMTYYSLWNFLFDQPFENNLKWMIVIVEAKNDGTINSLPIYFKRDKTYYNIESFVK
jgi:hypothetical protein